MNYLSLSNIAMIYLLGVALIAFRFGHGPSILMSFISVAAFELFFIPPRWLFLISNSQNLITFVVMLAVALIISNLASNLRFQVRIATHRERTAITGESLRTVTQDFR